MMFLIDEVDEEECIFHKWVVLQFVFTNWKLLFITLTLCVIIVQWIITRAETHSVFWRMGVPFVKPHLVFGSLHTLRMNLAIDVMAKWRSNLGDVFGYFLGWRPYLVIADLDMIEEILVKNFSAFSNRPKLTVAAKPVLDTVVGLRDQRWKDVRTVLTPTFSMTKMKGMAGIINKKIDILLKVFELANERPLECYRTFQALTLDVISECALASVTHCQTTPNDPLLQSVNDFLRNAMNPAILLALCFRSFAHVLSYVSNYLALSGRLTQNIIANLKVVISKRRENPSERTVDVLQLMLESPKLSDTEVIANAWVFLLGGFETTANALTYTSYLLATHPTIQERLYKEINDVLQGQAEVTYDHVAKMQYLDQVFSESLRLYPPVVSFIAREAAHDITIGQVVIPKEMVVMIPVWLIHHDPHIWPDPDVFDPERFSAEAKITTPRHPMSYIPFGAGPRNCIGMRFAQLEAKLVLARLVRRFKLEECEGTPKVLKFRIPTVAITPAVDVMLIAKRR